MTMEASAALPSGIQRYLLIREATAQKLGPRSQGLITYQVLTTEARRELYLRIAKNEGGGYVSDEAVPVVNLRRCVNEHPAEQPMRASAFKAAFIGRSSNNPTFAAAVMLTEGLLNRDPQRPGVLVDVASWQAWAEAQMAAAAGDLSEVLVGKAPKSGDATRTVTAVEQAAPPTDQAADATAGIDEAVMEDPTMPTDADGPSAPAGKTKRGRGAVLKRERGRH